MKLTWLVVAASVVIAFFYIPAIVSPFYVNAKAVVDECAKTKPADRTPEQRERCAPRPVGLIIPGIL